MDASTNFRRRGGMSECETNETKSRNLTREEIPSIVSISIDAYARRYTCMPEPPNLPAFPTPVPRTNPPPPPHAPDRGNRRR